MLLSRAEDRATLAYIASVLSSESSPSSQQSASIRRVALSSNSYSLLDMASIDR